MAKPNKYLELKYCDFMCTAEYNNNNELNGIEFEVVDNYDYSVSHTVMLYTPDLIKLRDFLNECFGDKP